MIWKKTGAGAVAGLGGGLVAAALLHVLHASSAAGAPEPALAFVAETVHGVSESIGAIAFLVYAVVIGAVFGWLLWRQDIDEATGLAWGGLYGAFWWIVSGLVVIPALRGIPPLTPAAVDFVRTASFAWFAASILDGVVLGGIFAAVAHHLGRRDSPAVAPSAPRRAA